MSDRAPDVDSDLDDGADLGHEPTPAVEPRPAIEELTALGPAPDAWRATHRQPALSDIHGSPPRKHPERPPRTEALRHRTGADVHGLPVDPDVEPEDRVRRAPVERRRHPVVRLLSERRGVLAVIAAGGALGALARWGTSVAWPTGTDAFPWATLQVNALGAFLIGVLMVLVRSRGHEGRLLRTFLGVGVLGGYTTFSTYGLDIHQLLIDHRPGLAGVYLVASVALGLVAAWLGVLAGAAVVRTLPDADGTVA